MKIINTYPFSFEGTVFDIYLTSERKFLIPLKPICDTLGLNWPGQLQRVRRDPVLEKHIFTITAPLVGASGVTQDRELVCITAQRLHYWFGGISVARLEKKIAEKLIVFKDQMADAVYAFFRTQTFPEEIIAELDAALPPEERRYFQLMGQAADLKRNIDEHGARIGKVEDRVAELEARLVGTDFINQAQARQYLNAVNALGDLLKERSPKKASPYAVIHNSIKQEFKVGSYQLIPEKRFPEVMAFLANWWKREAPDLKLPEVFTVRQDRLI
jgi:hypothetical protein